MAFCKFSTEYNQNLELSLSRVFVTDYLPYAPDSCTKVYLYGLALCLQEEDISNSLENFSQVLAMNKEDIKSSFLYWQDQGLVTVLNFDPIEVRYLNIKPKKYNEKMYNKEKYSSFNKAIQEVIDGRMITPVEYKEYYHLIESMHLEDSALVMIAKYCTNSKGNNVGYNYILTVAKNWAYQGVHTVKDVENKLSELDILTNKVKDILKVLKSKKEPSISDKDMYDKWTKEYGYDVETLLYIAKNIKRGGIERLDEIIENYYTLKLFSKVEIESYENNKQELLKIAKIVCKSLGLYYENLSPVINTYVLKWQQMGYSADAIILIANLCFKKFIRNFDEMDNIISKYYAKGIVSVDALNEYIGATLSVDKKIKEILEKLQLSRQVTSWDRDYYHTWTNVWQITNELLDYAISLSIGKTEPMAYLNKILSNWKDTGVDTLEKAKASNINEREEVKAKKDVGFITHSFSSSELNALFDNLDEVKLT